MRALATAMIFALGASPATVGEAGPTDRFFAQAQWGGSDGGAGGNVQGGGGGISPTPTPRSPTPIPQAKPPGAASLDRDTDFGARWGPPRKPDDVPDDKPPFPDDRDPFVDRPFLFLEDHDFHDDDFHDDDRIIVVPTQPVEPPEPEDAADAPVEPPAPPDPRGPKFVPVRGAAGAQPYSVGEPLPEDVPFVKLDWSRYGLPEPPPGLIYARVGGEVLLIDPVSRIVERRVDPAKLEAADSG